MILYIVHVYMCFCVCVCVNMFSSQYKILRLALIISKLLKIQSWDVLQYNYSLETGGEEKKKQQEKKKNLNCKSNTVVPEKISLCLRQCQGIENKCIALSCRRQDESLNLSILILNDSKPEKQSRCLNFLDECLELY